MFSNRVIGLFSQIPVILYSRGPSFIINYDAHTVLFLNSETLVTNNPGNSALDSSTNNFTITNTGSVTQGSICPFDPFEKSAYFNGVNTYLSAASNSAFGFETGDFTVECWVYPIKQGGHGASNYDCIIDFRNNILSAAAGVLYSFNNGTGIRWFVSNQDRITGGSIPNNKWTHLAVSRSSSSTKLFIDGVQSGSTYSDTTNYILNSPISIGRFYNGTATLQNGIFEGYISNVRVTKGQALYTSNFTPATGALSLTANGAATPSVEPLSSNVSLLTLQTGNLFNDNSTNNFTLSNTNVGIYPLYPFTSSSITYSSSAHGGSLYFNGSNWVTTPNISTFDFSLSSTNFTIEAWIYRQGSGTSRGIIGARQNITAHGWCLYSNTNNRLNLGAIIIGSSYQEYILSNITIPQNVWTHVALVKDSTGYIGFVNGISGTKISNVNGLDYKSAQPLIIGALGSGGELPFLGNISDVRITRGQALYTTNFTPPSAPLSLTDNGGATPSVAPLSSNISLHVKGTNAEILDAVCKNNIFVGGSVRLETNTPTDQIIADQSTNNFSLSTTSTIDVTTNSVYAVSGFSGYFNGTSYLAITDTNVCITSGDFTIECYLYTSDTQFQIIGGTTSSGLGFGYNVDNNSQGLWLGRLGVGVDATSNNQIPYNTWNHIAVTRSSGNVKFFVNGIQSGNTTASNITYLSGTCYVGRDRSSAAGFYYTGYISDLRITKGQALYTSNFTPPSAPLSLTDNGGATPSVAPLSSNISLLALQTQDKTFKDNSTNNFLLSNINNVGIFSFNPFYSANNILTYGGSLYFNGSSDISLTQNNSALLLSTNPFTIEFWFNTNSSTRYAQFIGNEVGSLTGFTIQINNANATAGEIVVYNKAVSVNSTTESYRNSTWNHLAFVRDLSGSRLYLNGVQKGTTNQAQSATTFDASSIRWAIGTNLQYANRGYVGYLSDLRITKGQALYTSNFTPPTASFLSLTANGGATPSVDPLSSNVSLLLNNFVPSLTSNNKSIRFPQNGFLQIPNINENLTLSSSDFTIEFNLFTTTQNVLQTVIDQRISDATQARLLVYINTSNKLVVDVNGTITTSTNNIPYKKWNKYSIFKTSGALGIAVNDVVDENSVIAESNTHLTPTNGTRIGTNVSTASASPLLGYVDDFKFIKGVSKFQNYSASTARAFTFDYLVVAGGGAGAKYPQTNYTTSGAGAGGLLQSTNINTTASYTYTISVGAGGAGGAMPGNNTEFGNNGGNSTLTLPTENITSIGGGGAASATTNPGNNGVSGGSGSGASYTGTGGARTGGAGTSGQGLSGGNAVNNSSGGGGGAGSAGGASGGNGGSGIQWLNGSFYAGGGGGSSTISAGAGGAGGGGNGNFGITDNQNSGAVNTGGGCGGSRGNSTAAANNARIIGSGGSGIVILRTSSASRLATVTGSPTITISGGFRYYTFTGSGTIKF